MQIPQISVEELKKLIDKREKFTLLDVRTDEEYAKAHIQNSFHIPLDMIGENVEKKLTDKNAKIYIYCLSGNRSGQACNIMKELGYKDVVNVENGLLAWRFKQYPLED